MLRVEPYRINAAPPMIRKSFRISSLINSEAAVMAPITSIRRRCDGGLVWSAARCHGNVVTVNEINFEMNMIRTVPTRALTTSMEWNSECLVVGYRKWGIWRGRNMVANKNRNQGVGSVQALKVK